MSENFINNKLWVLKTVQDKDRALQTVDAYNDKTEETYNYDSKVANHKQITIGDFAILIDKTKLLGFARINNIQKSNAIKIIRKCPTCGSSTIDKRKTLKPVYRCNKGHAFDKPTEESVSTVKYIATFDGSYIAASQTRNTLVLLKPYYIKNYNQNMSMQQLDIKALNLFPKITAELFDKKAYLLPAEEANSDDLEEIKPYHKNELDEREIVLRQIKARRGQKKFRDSLRERYGDQCMITGSTILDILEAAHINPYRGVNDNHPSNGLLLRADIHTLFDLNLIGIEPETFTIHIHKKLDIEYKFIEGLKLICKSKQPDQKSLKERWPIFLNKKGF